MSCGLQPLLPYDGADSTAVTGRTWQKQFNRTFHTHTFSLRPIVLASRVSLSVVGCTMVAACGACLMP